MSLAEGYALRMSTKREYPAEAPAPPMPSAPAPAWEVLPGVAVVRGSSLLTTPIDVRSLVRPGDVVMVDGIERRLKTRGVWESSAVEMLGDWPGATKVDVSFSVKRKPTPPRGQKNGPGAALQRLRRHRQKEQKDDTTVESKVSVEDAQRRAKRRARATRLKERQKEIEETARLQVEAVSFVVAAAI